MLRFTSGPGLVLAALALAVTGCSDSGAPSNLSQLNFNLSTQAAPVAAGRASFAFTSSPETFTDGTNTLIIDRVQLVLREIELHRAGVVADCADGTDDDCEELEIGPILVDLPLGTPGAARSFTAQIEPGSYDRVELEVHKPSSSSDAAFIQANPEFQDVSIRVTGTFNGAAFTYTGDFNDELEFDLSPELVAGENGATELTLFADLDPWFRDQSGALINPGTGNPGSANEGLVEQNIRGSLDTFEDEDHDGHDDHGGL